jgi:hypothetical protein
VDPRTLLAITLALAPLFLTLRYVLACWIRPFATCRKCGGKRHLPNRIGRGWHDCRRCNGTGLRLRWGRRAFTYFRHLHRENSR